MPVKPKRRFKFSWAYTVGAIIVLSALAGCTAGKDNRSNRAPAAPQDGEKQSIEGIDLVYVSAGTFVMGSSDEDVDYALQVCEQYFAAQTGIECQRSWLEDEQPRSTEINVDAFWIMQYEVTNAQFRGFVEGDGYTNQLYWTDAGWRWKTENAITSPAFWSNSDVNADDQPVIGVSWYEAIAFTAWLSAQTDRDFRLPTEAEWEKAARGTDGARFPWGDEWDPSRLNYCDTNCTNDWKDESGDDGYQYTAPIGTFDNASPYNVYDMAGNVREWTNSQPVDYPYEGGDRELPDGDHRRVLRGGGWDDSPFSVNAAYRDHYAPIFRGGAVGVRLVLPHGNGN